MDNSNSVWVFDWPSGRLCSLLTGQLGNLADLSACPTLPHTIAAASCEHIGRQTARLLSLRVGPVRLPALLDMPAGPALPALPAWPADSVILCGNSVPNCQTAAMLHVQLVLSCPA